jgi:hypothetical protein
MAQLTTPIATSGEAGTPRPLKSPCAIRILCTHENIDSHDPPPRPPQARSSSASPATRGGGGGGVGGILLRSISSSAAGPWGKRHTAQHPDLLTSRRAIRPGTGAATEEEHRRGDLSVLFGRPEVADAGRGARTRGTGAAGRATPPGHPGGRDGRRVRRGGDRHRPRRPRRRGPWCAASRSTRPSPTTG